MPAPRKDYSRLVAIDLSPTEAAVLFGFIKAALNLLPDSDGDMASIKSTVEGISSMLFKQLQGLDWPFNQEEKK